MPVMEQEKLLTVEDIAKMLNKSEDTVKRLFRQKDLPGFKVGGHWYMTREDWQKYIEEQKKK